MLSITRKLRTDKSTFPIGAKLTKPNIIDKCLQAPWWPQNLTLEEKAYMINRIENSIKHNVKYGNLNSDKKGTYTVIS